MNPQSALQQQFPLSPRKFWKKMLPKLYKFFFVALAVTLFSFFALAALQVLTLGGVFSLSVLLGVVVYLVLVLSYAWYVDAYIKRYYYSGEANFLAIKKGVFTPSEIHVQWQKIQDVYVDQDIFDRVMGLYDVHIASATVTSGIEAHIDGVDKVSAEGLKEFFLNKMNGGNAVQVPIQTQVPDQTQPSQPLVAKVELSESVSSKVYPLSSKWLAVNFFTQLIGSFVFSFIVAILFFIKFKDSVADNGLIYFLIGWIAVGLLSLVACAVTLALWKKNYAFDFTPDYIYSRQGMISISENHMPYSSVQDVTVSQSLVERIFGFAKVIIKNAAQQQVIYSNQGVPNTTFSGVTIQGVSLADANKIADIMKAKVLGKNSSNYGL